VIGQYDEFENPVGAVLLEEDAVIRARYYLDGLAAQYFPQAALTQEYNGIVGMDCDGAIAQITWTVGEDGASTTASRNTEHSIWIPNFPARRRAEYQLAPLNTGYRIGSALAEPE
jgi:hypothetical protein